MSTDKNKEFSAVAYTAPENLVQEFASRGLVVLAPEDLGGHSLRAGCATYLLEKEVPPAAVQKQMRHKSFNTTQQYTRGETARALVGAY